MENAKKFLNDFIKRKFSDKSELKKELFKAGVAALSEGWTFMDATFQLGGKARDDGLSADDVEKILRNAFAEERRKSERDEAQKISTSQAPISSAQAQSMQPSMAQPQSGAAPIPAMGPTIISPIPASMMEQMIALGLDSQSLELLQRTDGVSQGELAADRHRARRAGGGAGECVRGDDGCGTGLIRRVRQIRR